MECERFIPVDVLDDLCSRFIINVPEEERSDLIRICFQIESAHWFYIDFYSKNFPNRKPCGLREFALQVFRVYEETGFDISHLIDTNDYLEANVNEQIIRLYIIPGVKKCEKFVPKTRNEIKAVNWFPVYDIPLNKKDAFLKQLNGTNTIYNTFYMVSPFLRKIRQWIYENRLKPRREHMKSLRQRNRSCSDMDSILYQGRNLNFKESVEILRSYKDDGENPIEKVDKSDIDKREAENTSRMKDVDSIEGLDSLKNTLTLSQDLFLKQDVKSTLPAIREALHPVEELSPINKFNEHKLKSIIPENKPMLKKNKNEGNEKHARTHKLCCSFDIDQNTSGSPPDVSLSNESAFIKVEKKLGRRKRGRRNNNKRSDEKLPLADAGCDNKIINLQNEHESQEIGNKSLPDFKPIQQIPGWVGFKFDINAILKAMNDAVLPKNED